MDFYSGTMKNEISEEWVDPAIVLNVLSLAQINNTCSLISCWPLLLIFCMNGKLSAGISHETKNRLYGRIKEERKCVLKCHNFHNGTLYFIF